MMGDELFRTQTEQDLFISRVQGELDDYYAEMKLFRSEPLEEIFMKVAGWTARMSEVRTLLTRRETKKAASIRTREVEPFIEECDRQFKLYSRMQSVREAEMKLGGGVL